MSGVEVEDIDFKWGKQRGRGGKKNDVQFYESFTYDGVEYSLYDSVYLFKDGEVEPYIGKLIKIWEMANKTKRVKILWFFHPSDISNFLANECTKENELFLATGNGIGLANVNLPEVISGKCNVVCISKDERNRQPSREEYEMADYIFYRTFDVEKCTISDKLGEKIAGVEVRFLLNTKDPEKITVPKLDCHHEEEEANVEKHLISREKCLLNEDVLRRGPNVSGSLNAHDEPPGADGCGKASSTAELNMFSGQNRLETPCSNRDFSEEVQKCTRDAGELRSGSCQISNVDSNIKSSNEKNIQGLGIKACDGNNDTRVANIEPEPETAKGSCLPVKGVENMNYGKQQGFLGDGPLKKLKSDNAVQLSDVPCRSSSPSIRAGPGTKDINASSPAATTAANRDKMSRNLHAENNGSQELMPKAKMAKISNEKLHDVSLRNPTNKETQAYGQVMEVTRRPNADKSKWFSGEAFWEDKMNTAAKDGKLVLLQNLNPAYTSSEVEDIIFHGFGENCTAKMVQRTAISSQLSGQSIVVFKTREAAEKVVTRLRQECLMLPNKRPLVAKHWVPSLPGKQSAFPGHLAIDTKNFQSQKEKREAVSTSHSSQPNNLEYDLAMEWCLLQDRYDLCWGKLYQFIQPLLFTWLQQQGKELKDLKARIKLK